MNESERTIESLLRNIALLLIIVVLSILILVFWRLHVFGVLDDLLEGLPAPISNGIEKPVEIQPRDFSNIESARNTLENTGQIHIAYPHDSAPISYDNKDGQPAGYEIDLVKAIVASISEDGGFDLEIVWHQIDAYEREEAAEWLGENEGEPNIDLVLGAISNTSSRCIDANEILACTATEHWQDYAALLVESNSEIDGFCSASLSNKDIAVMANTSAELEDQSASVENTGESVSSINYARTCPEEIPYGIKIRKRSRKQLINLVLNANNNTDAYVTDKTILNVYEAVFDAPIKVVGKSDNPESYIFLTRSQNKGLASLFDEHTPNLFEDIKISWEQRLAENFISIVESVKVPK